jgi:hypothetical protein
VLCLHSSEVRIEGLEILDYLDNLSQKERFTEQGDAITFESEVTCVLMYKDKLGLVQHFNDMGHCYLFAR